jgi:adenine-specific DNA-methyltransferase
MTKEEMYGLFVIINSNYMDKYFRILNGSTQVNANEINSIPFPKYPDIIDLGLEALKHNLLDEQTCDTILEQKYSNVLIYKAI